MNMEESNIKITEIRKMWTQISPYFLDSKRNNQFDCFCSVHHMSTIIKEEKIEGDLVECGVYLGGNSIWLAKLFPKRVVWLMDSFEGVQDDKKGKFAHPVADPWNGNEHLLSCSIDNVKKNFINCNIALDEKIKFLRGWYRDTLYDDNIELPKKIAILRIDSDGYSSYLEVLNQLYDRVVPGGFVIFDDYIFPSICKQALPLFFKDKSKPTIWMPNGNLAEQMSDEFQHDLIYEYNNHLDLKHVASYMRKNMPEWKPNMAQYKNM